ncbi:hypothetical protein [Chroococcus sp. FPU101]|uniref:hypothetical protein n=1 Tax=Chroococcus sp. FPU101 TaxID=1974212 RepID=UPI001A8E5F22|nr:hypothetical protein [Chroococcus sp. FPU101]GFE71297.1 hypothetical protein CFPU101_39070 [Chroococcus sp. FPU101]
MVKNFLLQSFQIAFLFNLTFASLGCLPTQAQSFRLTKEKIEDSPFNLLTQLTPNAGSEMRSFFETGRLRSQDRILFQRPPSDVIPLRSESNAWQFIIFREGNSSFWMPPGVLSDETVILETSLGSLSFRTLASNAEDRRFVAAYARSLTQEQISNPQLLLEAMQQRIAPSKEFELKQKRSIAIDNFPGQELTFENAEEVITMRVYLVQDKIYALGERYPKANPLPRQTRAFLNAFELLEKP